VRCNEPAGKHLKLTVIPLAAAMALAPECLGMPQGTNSAPGEQVLLSASGPFKLGAGPVDIPLHAAQGVPGGSFSGKIAALAPGESMYLVLRGLSAAAQPGVVYNIYVGAARATQSDTNSQPQGRAGTLNFFNVVPLKGAKAARAAQSTRSIDVTEVLKKLQASGLLGAQLIVTVWPSGSPVAAAKPAIGRVDLVVSGRSTDQRSAERGKSDD
jgi:hypothetical protein